MLSSYIFELIEKSSSRKDIPAVTSRESSESAVMATAPLGCSAIGWLVAL